MTRRHSAAFDGKPEMFVDGIHPNAAGCAMLAKTVCIAIISVATGSSLLERNQAGGGVLHAADPLEDCNVVWDSPSKDASGSMPLGNGDIGLNVWAESDSDLFFYIGKTDSWTGDADYLAKLGRVRVHLDPNPFRKDQPFRQELRLRDSEIAISAGESGQAVHLRLRVDANHPVIHVEAVSEQSCAMSVTLEGWREAKPIAGERFVGCYRRQEWSNWRGILTYQHLGPVIDTLGLKDPLLNRTFGAIVMGDQFLPDGDVKQTTGKRIEGTDLTLGCTGTLKSAKADTKHHVRIHVLSAQSATPAEWIAQINDNAARYETLPAPEVRKQHLAYWNDFWNRSWIHLGGSADAKACAQGYALQRYIAACAGRGASPIKFNGSLFVDGKNPNDGTKPFNPDNRSWGPCYWFQNTRLIYWPLLAAGDFDEMQPLFRMYREILPLALERTKIYYNHSGAFFPETQFFFGAYLPSDYGFAINGRILGQGEQVPPGVAIEPLDKPRPGERGVVLNPWIRHEYCGGLELSAMMLDWYADTGDRKMAAETLVPVADAVLQFYYEHYPRDDKGRLRIYPSAALENQEVVANPMDAVAGLHRVIPGLLALPANLTTAAQRTRWETWRKNLPPMPMASEDGKPILGTEESGTKRYAREAPELYPVFPYQFYGVGKPDLDIARHTFNTRRHRDEKGWAQVPVQAACLGLTAEARRLAVHYLTSHDETRRFPAFWGPNFDGTPDQCHGGNCMLVLQRMLLQTAGSKILLLAAWPKDWDVDFKLHAPMNTTVRCVLKNGRIETLEVTPNSRRKDVVVAGPDGSPSVTQDK